MEDSISDYLTHHVGAEWDVSGGERGGESVEGARRERGWIEMQRECVGERERERE